MVDGMRQRHALLAVDVLEHVDGLVAAGTIVGLLILGVLGGILQPAQGVEELIGSARAVITIDLVGQLLQLGRQLLLCTDARGARRQQQKRQKQKNQVFIHIAGKFRFDQSWK